MSDALFDVVFYGILQTGKDKQTAMENMAKLFKTEPARLAPYFAGGRKVIKGKVSEEIALNYQTALENVGLVIKLEAVDGAEPVAEQSAPAKATSAPQVSANTAAAQQPAAATTTNDSGMTMAPVGADVIENPVEVTAQVIGDISSISMAEVGADVLENPPRVEAQPIADISNLTMAEPGANVLENPPRVKPQEIGDISDLSMAEPGANLDGSEKH
jgi:hypothetical protein